MRGDTILFHKLLSQKNERKISSECLEHLYFTAIHRGKIDLTADSRRVSVDDRKLYENGSVDADQLMLFR